MINESGIHPKGHRILVRPLEISTQSAGGIVIVTEGQKEREDMANTTGEVIEMGPEVFHDCSSVWCLPGDRVVFAKYSGLLYLGKDGRKYRIINDENIVAVLDDDVALVDPYLARGT